ncbi:conserved hypothetical protein [Shewanella baltica OS155]|uniref:DUF4234 domain-containing protein n=2 Tax=Shewanella baltica TaxID=62322 RepID=A3D096_SHEB5|nr:conserved hypothetical protein [Shewanella baltica OS155]
MMSAITELKDKTNTKTLNLVLLTIATAGIYPILWLYSNYSVIDSITKKKTADNTFVIWIAVCAGLGGALAGNGESLLDIISLILTLASSVLYIVWAFKAKSALQEYALTEHKIDLRMNGFYTFFFTVYYINYCINDLPEAQRKQRILTGHTAEVES